MSDQAGRGERRLERLLASLEPRLEPVPYLFHTSATEPAAALRDTAVVALRETEGWTLVLPAEEAGPRSWARIVLTVHSDLEAVGLLAAVAGRLAAAAIPVNAMAGWFHDHLFVPWERRDAALAALVALQREAAGHRIE